MADKTADAIKFLLRLPPALHKRLVAQARRNKISLNQEIVNQLEGHEAASARRTTELIQPMIESSSGAAVVVGEALITLLKPDAIEDFKKEIAKAGVAQKLETTKRGEREKE